MSTHASGRQTDIELGIRHEQVAVGDHIAFFWETESQFSEGVNFLAAGLRKGDFTVIFGYEEANRKVCTVLSALGFDCEALEKEGRLVMLSGDCSGDRMLTRIGEVFTAATTAGAPLIRLLGNIGWSRDGWPSEDDILAFEATVTDAARQFPCVVVCIADVQALPGRVILHGAFETHPLTMCGNVLRENPHHVPTQQFLSRSKAR